MQWMVDVGLDCRSHFLSMWFLQDKKCDVQPKVNSLVHAAISPVDSTSLCMLKGVNICVFPLFWTLGPKAIMSKITDQHILKKMFVMESSYLFTLHFWGWFVLRSQSEVGIYGFLFSSYFLRQTKDMLAQILWSSSSAFKSRQTMWWFVISYLAA